MGRILNFTLLIIHLAVVSEVWKYEHQEFKWKFDSLKDKPTLAAACFLKIFNGCVNYFISVKIFGNNKL